MRATTHGQTAGGQTSREYRSWRDMIQRCTNPKNKRWQSYGGRGISVCSRWLESFEAFYADMGPRPEGKTLDRRNVNGNYEPDNCRWATDAEQAQNKRPHPVRQHDDEIRALYASGALNQYGLADRFNVSQSFISELINEGRKKPSVSVRLKESQERIA